MSRRKSSLSGAKKLRPGLRLGNYVIERTIGAGSQAEVFLAQDTVLGRRVALKVFVMPAADPAHMAPIVREARMTAALDAPSIVRIHHVEQVGKLCYVALEYVDGGSLHALVTKTGPLALARAVSFSLAMADGLMHAHELGIVHSDINPKNLLINSQDRLKIADFGLAFRWEAPGSWGSGELRGTPLYMAPEIWRGGTATPQSDLYSAGACLYFMLTGRPPFDVHDLGELRLAHTERTVIVPADVPGPLTVIIQQCMTKRPSERIKSAQGLGQALRQYSSAGARWHPNHPSVSASRSYVPGEVEAGTGEHPVEVSVSRSVGMSGLMAELRHSEANAAIFEVPPCSEAAHDLSAALDAGYSLILLHGAEPADRARLVRLFLSLRSPGTLSLAAVRVDPEAGSVLVSLAKGLGVAPGASAQVRAGLLRRLRHSISTSSQRLCVHLELDVALSPKEAGELLELAEEAESEGALCILSCSTRNAELVRVQAAELEQPPGEVALEQMSCMNLAGYLHAWTRAATSGRFVWSGDALMLACDALESAGASISISTSTSAIRPISYVAVDQLAINAIQIAAHAHMRVITSWCVIGAAQHSTRIEHPSNIIPRWRTRPLSWPPPQLLTKLSELRLRWPMLARSSAPEVGPSFPSERSDP